MRLREGQGHLTVGEKSSGDETRAGSRGLGPLWVRWGWLCLDCLATLNEAQKPLTFGFPSSAPLAQLHPLAALGPWSLVRCTGVPRQAQCQEPDLQHPALPATPTSWG